MIEGSVLKLDHLIANLLSFSRNNRLEHEVTEIRLKKLFEENINEITRDEGSDFVVEFKIKDEIPFVSDASRINIVIKNIISNAVKYRKRDESQSFLKITVFTTNKKAVFIFQDNGEGITEENQGQIFNMFFRASERSDGSGLGLYIVKNVVEKLQGTIVVESEEKKGTTFTVELPNMIKEG